MSEKKQAYMGYICIFIFLTALCAMFPWCSDDWMWGSADGLELLHNGFEDYNGRYLGNLIVIGLTRSRILRAVFMAGTYTGLLFLLSQLTGKLKGRTALISALLFLMPTAMFAQAIAWTSGFTNYVPSVVISLVYIYLVRDIFDSQATHYRRGSTLLSLALGVAGSLFIEHITIYNIVLGIFVLVYTRIRFRRVYLPHIAFFAGTVTGAVIMFSNGAYRAVSQGTDWYRSMGHGITGILDKAWMNTLQTIIPIGFKGSCGLMVALCVAACMASGVCHGQNGGKWIGWHETAKTMIVVYTALVIIENLDSVIYISQWKVIEVIMTVLYLLSWIVFLLTLPVDSTTKTRLIFYFGSAVILIGCLLIVTPIGPRCLFAPYVFFCLLAMSLLNLAVETGKMKTKIVRDAIGICTVIFAFYYVSIYGTIALFDHARIEKLQQDLARGDTTLTIQNMIYGEYVWRGNPVKGTDLEEEFKAFYGIDEEIEIKNVGEEEPVGS